jgi:hypothetical protein
MTQKVKSALYMVGSSIIIIAFFLTWYKLFNNNPDKYYYDILPKQLSFTGYSLAQTNSGVWLVLVAGVVAFLIGFFTLKKQADNGFVKLLKSGLQITKIATILWAYFWGIASGAFARELTNSIGSSTVHVQYSLQFGFWLVVIGIVITVIAVWYPSKDS